MTSHSLIRFFIALALVVSAANSRAAFSEKLRVLSCEFVSADKYDHADFKTLLNKADPDVVLIQGVADWEACERICQLRPGLRVLTCSAFPNASQVAILARDKAVLSWITEVNGNGFAVAILQPGGRTTAVISAQTPDTERVLVEVKKLEQFANNRPESFLIASGALSKAALTQAGFETVPADAASKTPASQLWASNVGFLSRPRGIDVSILARPAVIADVDTANAFATKFAYQNALLFPGETPAPIQAVLQTSAAPEKRFPIGIVLASGAVFVIGILLLLMRRKSTMALVALNETQLPSMDPALNDPVRQGLLTWFKTMFMQRVIADRRRMIADQEDATRRTLAIEQKLSELQVSLQDRISGYENRIARLETELSAATFDNRELIRNQISELKEKVAKAKEESKAKEQFEYRRN
jgi:hypothetical protein